MAWRDASPQRMGFEREREVLWRVTRTQVMRAKRNRLSFIRNTSAHSEMEGFEPRAAALVAQSPFGGALNERPSSFDEEELNEEAFDELEASEELETEGLWEAAGFLNRNTRENLGVPGRMNQL